MKSSSLCSQPFNMKLKLLFVEHLKMMTGNALWAIPHAIFLCFCTIILLKNGSLTFSLSDTFVRLTFFYVFRGTFFCVLLMWLFAVMHFAFLASLPNPKFGKIGFEAETFAVKKTFFLWQDFLQIFCTNFFGVHIFEGQLFEDFVICELYNFAFSFLYFIFRVVVVDKGINSLKRYAEWSNDYSKKD